MRWSFASTVYDAVLAVRANARAVYSGQKIGVSLDGVAVGMVNVTGTGSTWTTYQFNMPAISAGMHTVTLDNPMPHRTAEL